MVTLVCNIKGRAATTDQEKKKRVPEHVKHWMMEPVLYQYTITFTDWLDRIWPCVRPAWMSYGTSRDADASGSDATLPIPEGMMVYIPEDRWAESSQDS